MAAFIYYKKGERYKPFIIIVYIHKKNEKFIIMAYCNVYGNVLGF